MDSHFDVAILGTGLTESIAAAALSKAGLKVAHIDTNAYYGADEASLTLEELVEWADQRAGTQPSPLPYMLAQHSRFRRISRTSVIPPQARQYAITLAPSVIPSNGPLISSLIASGVSRYGGFKLLERVGIYSTTGVKKVPGNKEDVFKSKDMTLVEKRKLMRFLMFASGEFEESKEIKGKEEVPFAIFLKDAFALDGQIAEAVIFALAYCENSFEPSLPVLMRIRRYLRSAGRYGTSPFLIGHYGSSGEIAQGFCRICAVNGGTYILGRQILSIAAVVSESPQDGKYRIELEDVPDILSADLIIASPDYLPPNILPLVADPSSSNDQRHPVARCIAIIDYPISFSLPEQPIDPAPESETDTASSVQPSSQAESSTDDAERSSDEADVIDTAILIFPPSSLPGGSTEVSVHVLITGEGSMSTPAGKRILHISAPLTDMEISAETLLTPYLSATLRPNAAILAPESAEPIFTLFYTQHPPSPSSLPSDDVIITQPPSTALPESSDQTAVNAEKVFWDALRYLRTLPGHEERLRDVDSFWPANTQPDDENAEEW